MNYIDSHSHLNFSQYNGDREDAIERMKEAQVSTICVGTSIQTSIESVELAKKYDIIWASVGIHPTEVDNNTPIEGIKELIQEDKVVAVGECGLDYFRRSDDEKNSKQKELFSKHIDLAKTFNLPLIIHCRPSAGTEDAYDDLYEIISSENLSGTVHFFVGSPETAQKFLQLGFHISFAGPITFTDEYDRVIESVPLERILIETDAPFAAPAPYRGQRNEPAYVMEVAEKVAKVKNMSVDEVARQTTLNALELFRISQ